jgi:hypothetical protein
VTKHGNFAKTLLEDSFFLLFLIFRQKYAVFLLVVTVAQLTYGRPQADYVAGPQPLPQVVYPGATQRPTDGFVNTGGYFNVDANGNQRPSFIGK